MPGQSSLPQVQTADGRSYTAAGGAVLRLLTAAGVALIDIIGSGWRSRTGTSAAGAITLAALVARITTEALTTAGLAAYTLTVTNSLIDADDLVFVQVQHGTNTQGTVVVGRVTPAAGSVAIIIQNVHASQALNGTLVISFFVVKTTPNL